MLIGDGSQLPDNYLSARAAANAETARKERYVLLEEIDVLWQAFCARCERAVLDGDTDRFARQARAMCAVQTQEKILFNEKVVHLLEQTKWWTQAREGEHSEDLTLTLARKFTDAMARHIYYAKDKHGKPILKKHEKDGVLYVQDCKFDSKERAMDAIR